MLRGPCLIECDVRPGNKRLSSLPLPRSGAALFLIGALIREGSGLRDPQLPAALSSWEHWGVAPVRLD